MNRYYYGIKLDAPGALLTLDDLGTLHEEIERWLGLEDFVAQVNEKNVFTRTSNIVLIETGRKSNQGFLLRGAVEALAISGVVPYYIFTTQQLLSTFNLPKKPYYIEKKFAESWPYMRRSLSLSLKRLALALEELRCRTFQPRALLKTS